MFRKNSITVQWLVSYALLLALPLIIFGSIFVIQQSEARRETYVVNDMILSSVQTDLDNVLSGMKRIYTEVCFDSDFQKTVYSFSKQLSDGMMEATKVHHTANLYVTSNNFINGIYIHFYQPNVALYTQSGIHDADLINEIAFGSEGAGQLQAFLAEHPRGGFCDVDIINHNITQKAFCYVGTYPINSDVSTAECLVMICADMEYVLNQVEALQMSAGRDVVVLDGENRIIFSTNTDNELKTDKRTTGMYSDSKNVVSFVELETADWCCAVLTPSQIFWEQLYMVRLLCIAGIALCLVLGVICTWYMLRRNYLPIQQMVASLARKTSRSAKQENEYTFLQNTLTDILQKNKTQEHQLNSQDKLLKKKYILDLLWGQSKPRLLNESPSDIQFISDAFMVLIFDVTNYETLFTEEKNMTAQERRESVSFIIENMMVELINHAGHECWMVDVNETVVGIVNLSFSKSRAEQDIMEACHTCGSVMEENFEFMLNVTVSSVYHGKETISQAYIECLDAMEFTRLTGTTGVFTCKDFSSDDMYVYMPEREIQLISAVRIGAWDKAKEILDSFFSEDGMENRLTSQKMKCLIMEIVGTLNKVIDDAEERTALTDIFYIKNSISEVRGELYAVVERLCTSKGTKLQEVGSGVSVRIQKYIDEHYADRDLNVQKLEGLFGLSRYYISRTFKSVVGVGIVEYLRRVRVDKAQAIMRENVHIRLEEVAETVGLNDTRTLTRVFRQELGITPGEYRKTLL